MKNHPSINMADLIKLQKGFTLIEVIVAAGLMTVVGLGTLSMMESLRKENTSIQQKLQSIELQQSINKLFQDSVSCDCIFAGLTKSPGSSEVSLTELKNGCLGGDPLAATGKSLSNEASSLAISTIKLVEVKDLDPTTISGRFQISFNPKSMVRSLRPITLPVQKFTIAGSDISGCLGSSASPTTAPGTLAGHCAAGGFGNPSQSVLGPTVSSVVYPALRVAVYNQGKCSCDAGWSLLLLTNDSTPATKGNYNIKSTYTCAKD